MSVLRSAEEERRLRSMRQHERQTVRIALELELLDLWPGALR